MAEIEREMTGITELGETTETETTEVEMVGMGERIETETGEETQEIREIRKESELVKRQTDREMDPIHRCIGPVHGHRIPKKNQRDDR